MASIFLRERWVSWVISKVNHYKRTAFIKHGAMICNIGDDAFGFLMAK
jgi:hypothetical protein